MKTFIPNPIPCPLCDFKAIFRNWNYFDFMWFPPRTLRRGLPVMYLINCTNPICMQEVSGNSVEDVLIKWNTQRVRIAPLQIKNLHKYFNDIYKSVTEQTYIERKLAEVL